MKHTTAIYLTENMGYLEKNGIMTMNSMITLLMTNIFILISKSYFYLNYVIKFANKF